MHVRSWMHLGDLLRGFEGVSPVQSVSETRERLQRLQKRRCQVSQYVKRITAVEIKYFETFKFTFIESETVALKVVVLLK